MMLINHLRLVRPVFPLGWTDVGSCRCATGKVGAYDYCISLVRQLDLEGFLLALNAELSRITKMSNTAALGRTEFWKEAINATFDGGNLQMPIGQALGETIRK
uniref:Uncharacterized protein n=1 Tax=Trichuris muris TaxID=70415 RepID=A0A5S6QCU0_TRIMR